MQPKRSLVTLKFWDICRKCNCPRPAGTVPLCSARAHPGEAPGCSSSNASRSSWEATLTQFHWCPAPPCCEAPVFASSLQSQHWLPMVSLHSAQTSSASGKGPVINLTYYLGKVTVQRLPAKSDSTASGELRLQGQASDCLGKSRAFCLSSPGGSSQTEPRPSCGKQGSLRTVPIHGAEAQSDFQAG